MKTYKYQINERYKHLEDWLRTIPLTFDHDGNTLQKKRNVIKSIGIPNGDIVVVKQYKKPNPFQRFVYTFFRKSKVSRAYDYGHYLLAQGIRTPFPIACIEEFEKGVFSYGYLVTEYIPSEDCFFLNLQGKNEDLLKRITAFIVTMHDQNFFHGDLNLGNFLVSQDNNQIYTIDINRSKILDRTFSDTEFRHLVFHNLARISHVPYVYTTIARFYAEARGWDVNESIKALTQEVKDLERHELLRGKITGKKPEFLSLSKQGQKKHL